jgi:hypothetical protein
MATTTKKAAPKKTAAARPKTGAGAAVAARSKDAKKTTAKAAPKAGKSAAASKPAAKTAKPKVSAKPSVASRVIGKVKKTATGAVAMATSVIGKDGKSTKARSK